MQGIWKGKKKQGHPFAHRKLVRNPHIFWFIFGLPAPSRSPPPLPPLSLSSCSAPVYHSLLLFKQEHPVLVRYSLCQPDRRYFQFPASASVSLAFFFPFLFAFFYDLFALAFHLSHPQLQVICIISFSKFSVRFRFPKNVTKLQRGWHSGVKRSGIFQFWNSEVVC